MVRGSVPSVAEVGVPGRSLPRGELLDWLRLSNSENVGPATFYTLLQRYRTARRAIERLPELSARGGHNGRLRLCSLETAERCLTAAERIGASFIAYPEPSYPTLLRSLDGPPPLICVKGQYELLQQAAVGIVGSRNASAGGRTLARRFAAELGHMGFAIVSGLARGIDTAAHEASLATGTIAVLAGGIDIVYPPENTGLAQEIGEKGLLITEMMPGTQPQAKHFPRRNRLIAGLSLGVVIVEAAERSGSLITARLALEQGREVFAVPGSPLDPRAAGTNALIRRGATLVTAARDIAEALDPMAKPPRDGGFAGQDEHGELDMTGMPDAPDPDITAADRRRVIELLGTAPVPIDTLIREADLDMGILHVVLLELELAGKLIRADRHSVALLDEPAMS
ncbi:DNA-processing protein DprA [Rhodoligotrophos ferricapiens]|uniref:DNA-processing protein DprA n=1 Tax=Rhodoligotrophos ferricapiens TaxID=3069264 RepID=UPI00315CAAC1